jgi:hypothetical protein
MLIYENRNRNVYFNQDRDRKKMKKGLSISSRSQIFDRSKSSKDVQN